jgi:hypothetical protein
MKKIISFCLWGDNPKYTIGAIKNAILTNDIYKGWISRFYCGQNVPLNVIDRLKTIENCEVIVMDEIGDWSGMFWRFLPASEKDVEVMLSRDCDSRLNRREKSAVDEWMSSNKSFHIMRDHPWHGTEILGGMWGVKYPKLSNMKKLIDEYVKGEFYQVDQNFLREKIYPLVKDDCIVHDEYFQYNTNKKPFPLNRKGQEFVGEVFDHMDRPNEQHRSMIKKQ